MHLPPHLASIDFCDYGFKMVIEVGTVVPVKSTITLGINPFTVRHTEKAPKQHVLGVVAGY